MEKVDYKFWADYIKKLVLLYSKKNISVLEVACGNCRLADNLVKYFPDYLCSDISLSMIRQNKNRLLKKVCFDMRNIPLKKNYDLIICAFDSINYLTNKGDIIKFFKQVSNILKKDGIFLFDAALEKNSLKHQKFASKKGNYNGILFSRHSIYLQTSGIHKNIFEIIYPDKSKFKEVHRQKIYPLEFYFEAIESAGLYTVECFKAFTFSDCKPKDLRAQFIVKRKSDVIN